MNRARPIVLALALAAACGRGGRRGGRADGGAGDARGDADAVADAGGGGTSAAAIAMRLGRAPNFLIGMGNDLRGAPDWDHNLDGVYTLGTTLDLHYAYLVGLGAEGGWPDWNVGGSFVNILADSAASHGVVPMFTLYAMASRGENNLAMLVDEEAMRAYWAGIRILFERLAVFGGPALVHIEPDFWAFAQQGSGGNAAALPARVGSLVTECGDLPEDLTGFGRCIVRRARAIAPRVVVGFHASLWAGEMEATAAFLRDAGAAEADVIVIDMLDRDAGCFEAGVDPACRRDDGPWYWDETNATSPNFREHLDRAARVSGALGKPIVWWQLPFGVPNDTPGGSSGRYRDNRVHYLFAHVEEFVAAGGVGACFGTGAANQTYITTDGDQFRNAVSRYFRDPVPLP